MSRLSSSRRSTARMSSEISELDMCEIRPGQLNLFSEIGRGRFKTVSSGCHSKHGHVAVLTYTASSYKNDIQILSVLSNLDSSAHVPEVYGVRTDAEGLMLVQELSSFGSVLSVLRDPELVSLVTPGHAMHMARQFADAVSFLEDAHIVHADLACRNFLVFAIEEDAPERVNVKLTDFASALQLGAGPDHIVKKMPQATRWCAPETVARNRWSHATDAWSLGVTLWELFAGGETPWTRHDKRSTVAKALRELAEIIDSADAGLDFAEEFPEPPASKYPQSVHSIVLSCLQVDAKARLSAKDIVVAFNDMLHGPGNSEQTRSTGMRVGNALAQHALPSRVHAHERATPRGKLSARSQEWQEQAPSSVQTHADIQGQQCDQDGFASTSAGAAQDDAQLFDTPVRQTNASPLRSATPRRKGSLANDSDAPSVAPSTRCPSTPALSVVESYSPDTARTPPSALTSFVSASAGQPVPPFADNSTRSYQEKQPLPKVATHRIVTEYLDRVRAFCTRPEAPQTAEDLQMLKEFLSSPEAVCGLDMQQLIAFRRRIDAALAGGEGPLQDELAPRIVPATIRETLVPLIPLRSPRPSRGNAPAFVISY